MDNETKTTEAPKPRNRFIQFIARHPGIVTGWAAASTLSDVSYFVEALAQRHLGRAIFYAAMVSMLMVISVFTLRAALHRRRIDDNARLVMAAVCGCLTPETEAQVMEIVKQGRAAVAS